MGPNIDFLLTSNPPGTFATTTLPISVTCQFNIGAGKEESSNLLFDARNAALAFLQSHQSKPIPLFDKAYVKHKGWAADGDPENNFFKSDEVFYWLKPKVEETDQDVGTLDS